MLFPVCDILLQQQKKRPKLPSKRKKYTTTYFLGLVSIKAYPLKSTLEIVLIQFLPELARMPRLLGTQCTGLPGSLLHVTYNTESFSFNPEGACDITAVTLQRDWSHREIQ